MSRDELRLELMGAADRLLSTQIIRHHMTDEQIRTCEAVRKFWSLDNLVTNDALDCIIGLLNML